MLAEPTDPTELHPSFAEALRADTESLNRRFSTRQKAGVRIDGMAFQQHLRTTVNALVREVASVQPERVRAVVSSLFDASLDLFAAGLLGPQTKHPHVSAAWQQVLPRATRLLARDPTQVAGCLSNAVDYLASQSAARPAEWIGLMRDLSPHCDSVQQWRDAGTIAAWRVGLIQFRSAALSLARQLPLKVATRSVGADVGMTESAWRDRLDSLEADRWLSPAGQTEEGNRRLRIVRTAGGFRGFGGQCVRPPSVVAQDGAIFVADGSAAWQLLADVFGTLWHRVPGLPKKVSAANSSQVTIDVRGRVDWDGEQHEFAELADPSSFACDGQTLAVTLPTSHHVFLLARTAKRTD